MINQVVLEGIVVKIWRFTEDLLFRLGKHYPGRTQRLGARHASVGGCRLSAKRIVWVKVNPDYEILFRLMDGLQLGAERRYWIREDSAEVDIGDMGQELGQMATEVKIALPMSHNSLTTTEEYVQ